MATFDAVAEPVSTNVKALPPRIDARRTGPAGRRRAEEHALQDPIRQSERDALRRRLLAMILRNEQLRRVRPR
jgi:hypothetical protein